MIKGTNQFICEHVLEVRYKPNPSFLDYRGSLAEMVSKLMVLPHWHINDNRVDVFDKSDKEAIRAFISFKNAGIVIRKNTKTAPITRNYFPDQANKFLRFILNQKPFSSPYYIERIGVRSRFITTYSSSFEKLLSSYLSNIINLTPQAKTAFNAELIDIGIPINLSTKNGKINSVSGPMKKEQISELFNFADELPEVGLYNDLDYWKEPKSNMTIESVIKIVKLFAEEIWDINQNICKIIYD